jgi:hypothetical protein
VMSRNGLTRFFVRFEKGQHEFLIVERSLIRGKVLRHLQSLCPFAQRGVSHLARFGGSLRAYLTLLPLWARALQFQTILRAWI